MAASRQQVVERLGQLLAPEEQVVECLTIGGRWMWGVENEGFLSQVGAVAQFLAGGVREFADGGMFGVVFTESRVLLTQVTGARWVDVAIENDDIQGVKREASGLSIFLAGKRRLGILANPFSSADEIAKVQQLLEAMAAEWRRRYQASTFKPIYVNAEEAERLACMGFRVEYLSDGSANVTLGAMKLERINVQLSLKEHRNLTVTQIREKLSHLPKGSVIQYSTGGAPVQPVSDPVRTEPAYPLADVADMMLRELEAKSSTAVAPGNIPYNGEEEAQVFADTKTISFAEDDLQRIKAMGFQVESQNGGSFKFEWGSGGLIDQDWLREFVDKHAHMTIAEIRDRFSTTDEEASDVELEAENTSPSRHVSDNANVADVTDQLLKLGEMYRNGLLTDDEFAAMKKRLIGM